MNFFRNCKFLTSLMLIGIVSSCFSHAFLEACTFTSPNSTTFDTEVHNSFTIVAEGADSISMHTKGSSFPAGVYFKDLGNGTAVLEGIPQQDHSSSYSNITFFAYKGGLPTTCAVQFFTLNINHSPCAFTSPNRVDFDVGFTRKFTIRVSEPYTGSISIKEGVLPEGVTFTDNGDGTATLYGQPVQGTEGCYYLVFEFSEGEGGCMSGEVTTCGDRKPIPVTARGKHLVVDIHCHLGVPAADAIVQAKYPGPPPGINDFTSPKTMEVNRAQFATMGAR